MRGGKAGWLALTICVAAAMAVGVTAQASDNRPGDGAPPMKVAATGGVISSATLISLGEVTQRVDYTFTVTGDTDDTGTGLDQVVMEVWDDGVVVASKTYEIPVGTTPTITDFIEWAGPLGTGAPGVGLYLEDPGVGNLASLDPVLPADVAPVPALGAPGLAVLAVLLAAAGAALLWRLRT